MNMAINLEQVGYHADQKTALAIRALLTQRSGGARALLVEGAPGTGKTALTEAVARATGAPIIYALLHSWSGADDLFVGSLNPFEIRACFRDGATLT